MVLKKNDIILVKSNGLISNLIHFFTKNIYNHAELYLGNYMILEAMPNGVKVKPMYNDLGEFDAYRYNGTITREQQEKIDEFIQKNINSKYDFIALFMQIFGLEVDRPKKFICIELVMKAYKYAGLPIPEWKKGFEQVCASKYFTKVNK